MERTDYLYSGEPNAALATAAHLHPSQLAHEAAEHDIRPAVVHKSDSDFDEKDEKASLGSDEKAAHPMAVAYQDVEDRQESFTPADLAAGVPFPESSLPHEDGQGLTIRALVVGTALGMVIAASNIYLGLKTGFTFGASLFGSLLGFVIIKAMSTALPAGFGGGYFGPKENVTIQSAATGAAGLTSMFVAAVPAMYRLDLLGANPADDFGRLFTFCFCSAFYACFFAIPLRKFYILKQKLVFPTPTATALAIRSLHTAGGALAARKKTKCLGIAFIVALVYVVAASYAGGILSDQHIFYWLYTWGWTSAIQVDNWGWYTTITPAFFGSGMLAGMNASLSFLGGLFLAYAVIGPSLVATGEAKCHSYAADGFPDAFTCFSTTQYKPGKTTLQDASPRYWVIWPAVLLMLGYSFAELMMNYKSLWAGMRSGAMEMYCKVTGKPIPVFEDAIPDPAPKEQQVNMLWVVGGLIASIVMTILVCSLQFNMNAGNVVLAILLAFIFSFIGIQSSGTTDINPLSAVAKASQLIVGGAIKGQGKTGPPAMLENLLAGSIASSAAAHSVDMVGDLKTGHWLRASPKTQFWAQLFGSLWATPISVGLYVLFSKAYPCINHVSDDPTAVCPFGAPSVAAWEAVSIAVSAPSLPVSLSSGLTAIMLTIVAMLTVVAKYTIVPADKRNWLPNWNAIGIGFLVPNTNYGISMATGAIFCHFWAKKYPANADMYAYALAAGFVAGEGIGGVVNAILQIANVSGAQIGSTVGYPPWAL